MSISALTIPGSVQEETKPQLQPEINNNSQQDIKNLAYALWQQRGCPEGSAEQDWLEAELLHARKQNNR